MYSYYWNFDVLLTLPSWKHNIKLSMTENRLLLRNFQHICCPYLMIVTTNAGIMRNCRRFSKKANVISGGSRSILGRFATSPLRLYWVNLRYFPSSYSCNHNSCSEAKTFPLGTRYALTSWSFPASRWVHEVQFQMEFEYVELP